MITITKIIEQDWQAWKTLRLEALKNAPEAFASSLEEGLAWQDEVFKQALKSNVIYGAFDEEQLIGMVGFYTMNLLKTRHKGVLWGLYVEPQFRNQGVAEQLIQALIAYAQTQVLQLYLTVTTSNAAAIALYQKNGFKIYGTEVRSLKVKDQFFDEYLMVLEFSTLGKNHA